MSPLFETIKICDGRIFNNDLHNSRLNNSRRILFSSKNSIDLLDHIIIPQNCLNGLFRCRIEYGKSISKIEFFPYTKRAVKRLICVENNSIDYTHKFTDRSELDSMRKNLDPTDEILIIKNNFFTDTSFSNIAFFDGSIWFTPANPLLKGTKRAYYVEHGIIIEKNITLADLPLFEKASLINAMLDLGEAEIFKQDIIYGTA